MLTFDSQQDSVGSFRRNIRDDRIPIQIRISPAAYTHVTSRFTRTRYVC